MQSNTEDMISAIKSGIDNNSQDSPALSIDPKTSQVSVVGDPNNVKPTSGDYDITFVYPSDTLTEDDKKRMKRREGADEYEAIIHYRGKRVKPLYRTMVAMRLAEVLTEMGIISNDGYNTEGVSLLTIKAFMTKIDAIADVAAKVLDIPEDQIGYMEPESLISFFTQLLGNEPNIVNEAAGFLEPSLVKNLAALQENLTQQDTQQS